MSWNVDVGPRARTRAITPPADVVRSGGVGASRMRLSKPDAAPVPDGSDQIDAWTSTVVDELHSANLIAVVSASTNALGNNAVYVGQAMRQQWAARSIDVQRHGKALTKKCLKAGHGWAARS